MSLSAVSFIQNRQKVISITDSRIRHILWYIVECYQLLQIDNPKYSKSLWKKKSTIPFEDYLKMELVDNYLIKQKDLLQARVSKLVQINFSYETQKRYVDFSDNREKPDKIDIYINKLGLQNEWKEPDENVYFAVECKRIKILSDTKDYVLDIQKFSDRNHTTLRLPFEGMIAFIENKKLSHLKVSQEINNKLKSARKINTSKNLTPDTWHSKYVGTYSSIHNRNFKKVTPFSIFHLLFDYSQNVTN